MVKRGNEVEKLNLLMNGSKNQRKNNKEVFMYFITPFGNSKAFGFYLLLSMHISRTDEGECMGSSPSSKKQKKKKEEERNKDFWHQTCPLPSFLGCLKFKNHRGSLNRLKMLEGRRSLLPFFFLPEIIKNF